MLLRVGRLSKDVKKLAHQTNSARRWFTLLQDEHRLRILFCGSDDFSVTSLKALHQYSKESGSVVASIDVATKTDKRVGRGLKIFRPPPIKPIASDLGLPVHQFDTFRGWNFPTTEENDNPINMVIAVSFGLLVPPRILEACQYGGLNVHPSMLPDLKGSAPIEHAIIHGYTRTGVTIQTLHPSRFDEGNIVMQTPSPGLEIPYPEDITSPELRDALAPIGAEMLIECLRGQHYLRTKAPSRNEGQELNHAPKLSPESRHIRFKEMSSTHILRLNRALGRLWVNVQNTERADTRLIFGGKLERATPDHLAMIPQESLSNLAPGVPFNIMQENEKVEETKLPLIIKASDSEFLMLSDATVSGMKPGHALASIARAGLIEENASTGGQKLCVMKGLLD